MSLGLPLYVSTLPKGDKFAPPASACLFLDYSNSQKGYKVQDLTTKRMFVSRDVSFHETLFPLSNTSLSEFIFHPLSVNTHIDTLLVDSLPPFPQPQVPTLDTCLPRHSTRISRPPIWSQDYICSFTSSSLHHISHYLTYNKLSHYLTYNKLSSFYKVFLSKLSARKKPTSYHEAIIDPYWRSAMDLELQALENNHTWEIVDIPSGNVSIGNKWV
ncbi:uncharacterized protein [Primulina huaijiensis]|uniref:uncharacterized protein n=1 Tax=Primulina huaijiensis TaxID=1492673 RepID=UPI003CC778DE